MDHIGIDPVDSQRIADVVRAGSTKSGAEYRLGRGAGHQRRRLPVFAYHRELYSEGLCGLW